MLVDAHFHNNLEFPIGDLPNKPKLRRIKTIVEL